MDDIRFDGLARALAAQPSRRAITRFLIGGVAGGVLAARGWGRATVALAGGDPPVETSPENSAQGDCSELGELIRRGVKGSGKQRAPGLAGSTEPHLSVGVDEFTINLKKKGKKVCGSAKVTFRPKANPRSFRLDWTPEDAADPAGCAAEVAAWVERIEQHERDHYRAAQQIGSGERTQSFSACKGNKGDAADAVRKKVVEARDKIGAELNRDWEKHLEDYHNEHGEDTPSPDCQKCCPEGTCCPPTPKACEGFCCAETEQCCGTQCCAQGQQCCGGTTCCPPGQQCCDGTCRESCDCVERGTCETKIYCRCNRTCYDSAVECTSNCRAGLGCFTDICRPALPGEC